MSEQRNKRLALVLLASLALNLVLGGYLIFGHLRDSVRGPGFFPGLPGPRVLHEALPDERGEMVRRVLADHRDEVRAAFDAMFESREQVAAAIRAEPFDPGALDRELAGTAERQYALIQAHQRAVADLVGRLDAADRARIADLLQRVPPRPPRKGGRGGPPEQ